MRRFATVVVVFDDGSTVDIDQDNAFSAPLGAANTADTTRKTGFFNIIQARPTPETHQPLATTQAFVVPLQGSRNRV